jgi:hypothetical protein
MTMIEEEATPLIPELRALGQLTGVPIVIAGETWLLAHGGVSSILDPYRNRMDDQSFLSDQVSTLDVWEVARILLLANYAIADEEVIVLLEQADPKELTETVANAIFGNPNEHRRYTHWSMTTLYANGLDPEKIPADYIPRVLDYLVKTNRAIPINRYTDSGIAAPILREKRARAAERQARIEAAEKAKATATGASTPTGDSLDVFGQVAEQ